MSLRYNPTGTALVHKACVQWPALPSRTLARKLVDANKGVWPSIEACRCAILRRRGRLKSLRPCKNIVTCTAPRVAWVPDKYLPRSEEKPFLPLSITVAKDATALVMGDLHVPYQNNPAVAATLSEGRRKECSIIILNGDTLDFHRLSRFQKDPRARGAKEEISRANQLIDAIDDFFPKARKIFKFGNHDERYDHYLVAHAEEIFDLVKQHANLPRMLELESRGWEWVDEKRPIYLGGLTIIHGHEYPTPVLGPVNAARGLFLRAKASAMVNHHHQTSEHTDPTIRQKIITTWSLGCLCDLHPMYARFNRWNHGAATIDVDRRGNFSVHNFRIHRGRLLN